MSAIFSQLKDKINNNWNLPTKRIEYRKHRISYHNINTERIINRTAKPHSRHEEKQRPWQFGEPLDPSALIGWPDRASVTSSTQAHAIYRKTIAIVKVIAIY